jgi:hypothetical protein
MYQNGGKDTKRPNNIPKDHKIYLKDHKIYQNTTKYTKNTTKYTKRPRNIPKDHKIYQKTAKYIKCPFMKAKCRKINQVAKNCKTF